MTMLNMLAGAAAIGALAAPAAAQYYPQPGYPQQQYQQYPQQQPYQGYGYQGTTGNPVTDVIDSLLGNRYSVTDRQAVRQCARAAQMQARGQYGGGYGNPAYGQQQIAAPNLRVTSINGVERRGNYVRVSGLMSTGYGNQYGSQYAYRNRDYPGGGDVSFRCNVDYNGQVTNVRIGGGSRRY